MTLQKFNLALIGCGAAAQRYYVPALKKYSNRIARLFLVDRIADLSQSLAKEIGYGEAASDLDDVIESIDGAVILLPNHLHYEIARQLVDAGKHVLCEKPLTEDADEADDLVARAAQQEVGLCVNNTRRMYPAFQKIRELIQSGALGRLKSIRYVEGNEFGWNSETGFSVNPALTSRGVLNDVGPHVMDTICWWLGDRPNLIDYHDDSFGGPESVARANMDYDGCKVEVFLNRLNELKSGFTIEGDKGRITGDQYDWKKVRLENISGRLQKFSLKCAERTYPEFVLPIFENFIDVIQGSAEPLIPGREVTDSIHLIDACYHNRVRFDMPWTESKISVESEPVKTLITGATGSIGGRVVEMFHLSGARIPVAAIRQWGTAARIGRFPIEIRRFDLLDPYSINQALEGISEIIHCAKGDEKATVEGTRNLLTAASKHGIRKIVHMSTAEVYGDVSGRIDESFPLKYTGEAYNRMKVDAEKVCWEFIEKGVPISILRPSIVYGPFSKNWSTRFAKLLIDGRWGIYEKYGNGNCNLIYIDDLVQAMVQALDNEKSTGQAFNIVSPDIPTWNDYFTKFNEKLNLPPLRVINSTQTTSKSLLIEPIRFTGKIVRDYFMGPVKFLSERIDSIKNILKSMELSVKATPSPAELQLYNKVFSLSPEKSISILSFSPKFSLEKGLDATNIWSKHNFL